MKAKSLRHGKKFFTVREANSALPLVRAIVQDITSLAASLKERYDRLQGMRRGRGANSSMHQEELQQVVDEFERDQERLKEFEEELTRLGVLLKDPQSGLIDFPCWMDEHEVYLCWKLGEAEVAHWHEIDAGYAGRQKLAAQSAN